MGRKAQNLRESPYLYGNYFLHPTIASYTPSVICNVKSTLSLIYKEGKWFSEWVVTVGFLVSEGGKGCCNETCLTTFVRKLFSFCMV